MEDKMNIRNLSILMLLLVTFSSFLWAEKSLERIANEKGVEGETFYNEGKFLEAAKAFETAIAKLKEAVKKEGIPLDNEKISRWLLYAFQGYYQGKKYENALQVQNERIKLDPGSYKLISTKAKLLKNYLNRVDEAVIVLKNYNNKKRSFKVEKKIGLYYSDLKDYENALIWYKKAYELKQDSGVIKNIAIILYKYLGRNEDAIKAYEDFIQTNPKESVLAQTYKNMGSLYEDIGSYSKANVHYEKSLALKYDKDINLKLIISYYDNDNFAMAKEKINQRLGKKSSDADAIYYRAMIKVNENDKPGAKADFKKLLGGKYNKSAKGWIESIESE
jgi:tetratricopeptide (TPR) repeat protein